MTQPTPEVYDADAEGASVERVPSPENPEYDEPTARHFVGRDAIEPDATPFEEVDGEPVPVMQVEVEANEYNDLEYDTEAQVTLPGAVATAREIYERDILEVELPEIDRSGRGSKGRIEVDGTEFREYMEETVDEFGGVDNATVGVSVALESAFEAIVQAYDGDAEFEVGDVYRPWDLDSFSSVVNSGDEDNLYNPDVAEEAVEEYRDRRGGKDVLTEFEQGIEEEEEGGIISRLL